MMTQLSDKEHNVQMEDMRSFDEQMPIDQRIDALIKERATADGVIDVETAREMTHGAIRREYALDRDMTPDELYDIVAEEIDAIYALG